MTNNDANSARNPDSLPDTSDPSGPCPWCTRVSNFSSQASYPLFPIGHYVPDQTPLQRVAVLECHGCGKGIIVVEDLYIGGTRHTGIGAVTYRGFHWWPTPGTMALDAAVPLLVGEAYNEALRCLSAKAPNGAVAMLRTTLTWIVEDKASPKAQAKSDLKDKVKAMVADGGLPSALGEWADHVRLYGNAGVHPDKFGDVSLEEAEEVARLTFSLIESIYVLPANIAKRQAARRP